MRTVFKYKRLVLTALLAIWAVAFAAAQAPFVVTVGETRPYFVEAHEGSEYQWSVYNESTFTMFAGESEAGFPGGNSGHTVNIHWKSPGMYYVTVVETDLTVCTNTRALAVSVLPNNRSARFETFTDNACFDAEDNGFSLPLVILDNDGLPLAPQFFPLKTDFSVNGSVHSVILDFNAQKLRVDNAWFDSAPGTNTTVTVELLSLTDNSNLPFEIIGGTYTRNIFALPVIGFVSTAPDTIPLNTFHTFEISGAPGYTYNWWYKDVAGNQVPFASENHTTEEVFWGQEGDFTLFVQATDANGCLSEIISKLFNVIQSDGFVPSLVALPDINVGYENTTLYGDVSTNDFDFLNQGADVVYSLEGAVVEGLEFNSDGSYTFTPPAGFSGTVGFSYRLCYVEHSSPCTGASVEIHVLPVTQAMNNAPVAATDVAFTLPGLATAGNLLANDVDPDGFGVPLTLHTTPLYGPQNGSVTIHADGTFTYTPSPDFEGTDRFMYRVCDSGTPVSCDSAWVYVFVGEFGNGTEKPVSVSDDIFLYANGRTYSLSDNDSGENLVYQTDPLVAASHGTVRINSDGTFTYEPEPGYEGVDWFVYRVCSRNHCMPGTAFMLVGHGGQWPELAGRDTTVSSCEPVMLNALAPDESFTYSWQPAALLDNPTSRTPVFTPGETTVFVLTVSNPYGFVYHDSLTITVSALTADAGDDVFLYSGEKAVLDGSLSEGSGLAWLWTTENGVIESGETTANPVVSQIGTYYLQVTDQHGCTAVDSVNVGLLTWAPVANNDYDTTGYRIAVEIDVLANDTDQDGDIDPATLTVTVQPMHGSASVDYSGPAIVYQPGRDFHGNDYFEYRICDVAGNCSNGMVYVLVNDFRFFIPDAFSPNNDGVNDYFEILGIQFYEGNSLEIFNRWGNRVYRAENYGIDTSPTYWDGKSNTGIRLGNEELPTGTYFYVLDLGNGEKRIVGSVYLDR